MSHFTHVKASIILDEVDRYRYCTVNDIRDAVAQNSVH